jgi:hypothetical protein
LKKLQEELETVDKTRIELVKRNGVDDNGEFPKDKLPEIIQEFEKMLMDTEVEVDVRQIAYSQFTKEISAADLLALDWMFIDDSDKEA